MDVGMVVRVLRTLEHMSQSDLAQEVGITPTYLSQIEKGNRRPGLRLLERLAGALDVHPSLLLLGEHAADAEVAHKLVQLLSDALALRLVASKRNE